MTFPITALQHNMSTYKPKVAIVGLTGRLGQGLLTALRANSARLSLPVNALGRDTSKKQSDETVRYFSTGNLTDPEVIREALTNVDVVIDALGFVKKDTLAKVASEEGVKVVFLGNAGVNMHTSQFKSIADIWHETTVWERTGVKTVQQFMGWFSKWFIEDLETMGFDLANGTVELSGTGDEKVTWTHEEDFGRVVAELATWKPEDIPSELVYGGDVKTYNELVAMVEGKLGRSFRVTYKPAEEALNETKQILEKNFSHLSELSDEELFRILRTCHLESGVAYYGNDYMNNLINPSDSLWKWTPLEEVVSKHIDSN